MYTVSTLNPCMLFLEDCEVRETADVRVGEVCRLTTRGASMSPVGFGSHFTDRLCSCAELKSARCLTSFFLREPEGCRVAGLRFRRMCCK